MLRVDVCNSDPTKKLVLGEMEALFLPELCVLEKKGILTLRLGV